MTVPHWAATHRGQRASNQDAYLCRPELGLFAVADGVGNSPGGARASSEVVRALDAVPPGLSASELLAAVRSGLHDAHARLLGATEAGTVTATTVVVLLLHRGHAACLWAGDSRAYLLRRGELHRLTSDHSVVGDMLRAGILTEAEAEAHPDRNVITRAIGGGSDGFVLDKAIGVTDADDRFLLCSDGLTKSLGEAEIARLLAGDGPAEALIAAALERGGRDNVTALAVVARP